MNVVPLTASRPWSCWRSSGVPLLVDSRLVDEAQESSTIHQRAGALNGHLIVAHLKAQGARFDEEQGAAIAQAQCLPRGDMTALALAKHHL